MFSDDWRYNSLNSDGIQYIPRVAGKRLNPKYTLPTVKHRDLWWYGYFSAYEMGALHLIEGTMDRYMHKNIMELYADKYAALEMVLIIFLAFYKFKYFLSTKT